MDAIITYGNNFACVKSEVEQKMITEAYYVDGVRHWKGKNIIKMGGVYQYPDGGKVDLEKGAVVEIVLKGNDGLCVGYEARVKLVSYDVVHIETTKEIDYKKIIRRIKNG